MYQKQNKIKMMTPNYLRKHEFLEINSLCNECLLLAKMTHNDEIKERIEKIMKIVATKDVFKLK